jgi:hypothetical protein
MHMQDGRTTYQNVVNIHITIKMNIIKCSKNRIRIQILLEWINPQEYKLTHQSARTSGPRISTGFQEFHHNV